MTRHRDVIIIGSGISGASAAIQAARAGLNILALFKPEDHGYWARVNQIHYFPGARENDTGSHLINKIKSQAEFAGAAFQGFEITSINVTDKRTFQAVGNNGEFYEAPTIIIASGVSKDEHFLVGERELVGKGVCYSVINDAPTAKNKPITIIGKSDQVAQAVIYIAKFASKIYFVIPSSKLDAPEKTLKDLEANKRVELLFSSSIKKLNGTDALQSVTILSAGTERDLESKCAFICTHNLKPCSLFAKDIIETDKESGRILVNSEFSTSRPGIFACGDVLAGVLQNPAISAAQGIIAAINAEKFLNG